MAKLINRRELIEDRWAEVADDTPLPEGDVVVSLSRLRAEANTLAARPGRLGLRLEAGEAVEEIVGHLPQLDLVALHFPVFADGRHYSSARLLRERYGFRGEVRATGDVLRDQLLPMARCGFSTFALRDDQDPVGALRAFGEFSVRYQPAEDEPEHIFRRREEAQQATA